MKAAAERATPARSAHTVAALGDSLPPEPPPDEACRARTLEERAPRLRPR